MYKNMCILLLVLSILQMDLVLKASSEKQVIKTKVQNQWVYATAGEEKSPLRKKKKKRVCSGVSNQAYANMTNFDEECRASAELNGLSVIEQQIRSEYQSSCLNNDLKGLIYLAYSRNKATLSQSFADKDKYGELSESKFEDLKKDIQLEIATNREFYNCAQQHNILGYGLSLNPRNSVINCYLMYNLFA